MINMCGDIPPEIVLGQAGGHRWTMMGSTGETVLMRLNGEVMIDM
jgi:hypothetical protein